MQKLTRKEREMIKLRAGLSRLVVDSDEYVSGIYINPPHPEAAGMLLNMGTVDDVKGMFLDKFRLLNNKGQILAECFAVSRTAAAVKFYSEYLKKDTRIKELGSFYN
jgi:hypothetical protein